MQQALSLLVDLEPSDIDRLLSIGTEREVHREDIILEEGRRPQEFLIVLEGLVEAKLDTLGGHSLGLLGPGELLGEIAWLEDRPCSATVRAAEDSVLLAFPHPKLTNLLQGDPSLSARFHRSLGRVVSQRLRARSQELGGLTRDSATSSTLRGLAPWLALEPVIDGLKELMQEAEKITHKAGGTPPRELFDKTGAGFAELCRLLTRELGSNSIIDENVREKVGAHVRRELHPYLMLTRIVERIYSKPRGYAGDFLTIRWMYDNETGGVGAAGKLIDTAFLERPAAKAVRNRRRLLAGLIESAIERGGKVTSLACGPAEELFDVFSAVGPNALHATCLDIDLQALALVADRRDQARLKGHMRLEQANLVYLATGRAKLDIPEQNLVYSIGLIDYFQDRFVVALLDWIHDRLAPGGCVVLGNFHPHNPDRALMDHVLDWRLIHRDEGDMNRLFEASKFAAPCSEIRFEEEGVNLFAMGHK